MTAPVASPCTQVCRMDEGTGWCLGCARRLDEIAGWSSAPEAVQRRILALLPERRQQLLQLGLWQGPAPVPQEWHR